MRVRGTSEASEAARECPWADLEDSIKQAFKEALVRRKKTERCTGKKRKRKKDIPVRRKKERKIYLMARHACFSAGSESHRQVMMRASLRVQGCELS